MLSPIQFFLAIALSLVALPSFSQPLNDDCSNAELLSVSTASVCGAPTAGSTDQATASPALSCPDCAEGKDVWYRFTATRPSHLVTVSDALTIPDGYSGLLSVAAYAGTCGSLQPLGREAEFYQQGKLLLNNLTAGQTYYLRVFTPATNDPYPSTFQICINTPPSPANDECAGAVPLIPNAGLICTQQTSATFFGATASNKDCTGGAVTDLWYAFAATGPSHRMVMSPSAYADSYGFELYEGSDCDHLNSAGCVQGYIPAHTFEGLVAGKVYYLRVFSTTYQYLDFQICIVTLPPPPVNDACTGALPMAINPDYLCNLRTYGSTLGAASSQPDCGSGEPTHDVWHSFTATAATHRLEFSYVQAIFGDYQSFSYQVYQGGCGSLNSLVCKRIGEPSTVLGGLTPGETYWVRAYSPNSSNHTYELCIQTLPPPPANASCATATVLTSAPLPTCGTPVTGTTEGLVLAQPAATCSQQGAGMFVWYTFQATQSAQVVQVSGVQQRYGQGGWWLELYEGGDCGALNKAGCYNYNAFSKSFYLKNLNVGATYYLRFGSQASTAHTFQICLGHYPSPANDNCAGALPLTIHGDLNCYYPTTGNTASSTASQPATACLGGQNDVWFRFKALQTAQRIAVSEQISLEDGTYQPLTMELLTGDCSNLTSLNCWSNSPQNPHQTFSVGDLQPGQTYYLRFSQADEVPTRFLVCLLTPPPPPANDRCADAILLTPASEGQCDWTAGTTKYATSTLNLPAPCCEQGDVWYQFTASQSSHDVQLSQVTSLYNDDNYACCGGSIIEVYASGCGGGVPFLQKTVYYSDVLKLANLSSGATYFVRVSPIENNYIRFDICVSTPAAPENDNCSGALPFLASTDLSCFTQTFNTYAATTSSRSGCDGVPVSDLWYQFTATATVYRFDFSASYGGGSESRGIELLAGDCGDIVPLACRKLSAQAEVFEQGGFIPGDTYYVRLWSEAYQPQAWWICTRALPEPPPNDDCANALPLTTNAAFPCNAAVNGNTLGATQSLPGCAGGTARDVWYSFTAQSVSNLLEITVEQQLLGENGLNCELLAGDCATGSGIFCKSNMGGWMNWWVLPDLVPGQKYYLRVFSRALEAHRFLVCLTALPKPPNDDCAQATVAAVNPDLNCQVTYPGTTVGASIEGNFERADVWYVFTALNNSHLIQLQNTQALYGWNGTLRFQVYEGSPCGNGALLGEFDPYNQMQIDGLVAGKQYTVRVFSMDMSSAFAFDFCIRTLPPAPANSSCLAAQPLPVNAALTCDVVTHGSTAGLTDEFRYGVRCYPYDQKYNVRELWYSFTAITPNHRLRASNVVPVTGFGNGYLEVTVVKSTDCEHFEKIGCLSLGHDLILPNLTPGQIYYVVVSNGDNEVSYEFDFCISTFPVPVNDLCEQATLLPVAPDVQCGNPVAGTTLSASVSSQTTNCIDAGNDVWYSFIGTHSAHTVQITDAYGIVAGGYFSLAVYAGDDCGHLQNLSCGFQLSSTAQISLGDLVSGKRYWVRIWQPGGDINFNICITTPPEPPANDACINAVTLPVSPDLTCSATVSGTTEGAYPSTVFPQTYYQYYAQSKDVWYKFTATQSNHAVVLSNYFNSSDYFVQLRTEAYAGTCGALTLVAAANLYDNKNGLKLLDLTPGETYYVRLFNHPFVSHTFDLCVVSLPAPPNDECTGAILLEENADLECQSKTVASIGWATQSAPDCSGGKAHDVWFKFVATTPSYRLDIEKYSPSGNVAQFGMEVLEGSCGALSLVLPCAAYAEVGISLHQLSVGKTYYVRLYAQLLDFLQVDICLRNLPEPPSNDHCGQAIVIQPGTTAGCDPIYTGTTLSSTPSDKTCNGQSGDDVWYTFTATSARCLLELTVTRYYLAFGYLGFTLYKGNDCGSLSEVECFNVYGTPVSLPVLTVGDTYYLRVFGAQNAAFDFSLCLRNIPTHTNCASSIRITPSLNDQCGQPVSGSTAGLSEWGYSNCDGSYYHTELWYRFTATSGLHIIRLQNIVHQYGSGFLSMELSSDCFSYPRGCGQEIFATNLIPGQEYFIRVIGQLNSGSRFDLCVLTPQQPDNDNCPGVVTIPVSPNIDCAATVSGTTLGATGSYNKFNCKSGPDVLYQFVATNTRHYLRLSNLPPTVNYDKTFLEVLEGPCGNWTASKGCYSITPELLLGGLAPGKTYYLRVGSIYPEYFNFDLCIATPQPDLSIFQISPQSDGCQPGKNETVDVYFINWGYGDVPVQAAQFTLVLSGANSGTYGPVSNPSAVGQYNAIAVTFTNVDLSNPGETQFTVSAILPNDLNPNDNIFNSSFTSRPVSTYYLDADQDGYGDLSVSVQGCQPPDGYVDDKTDCDDADPARNAGAPEICNGYDDNCDGLIDAADPGLSDAPTPDIVCPDNIITSNDPGACAASLTYAVTTSDHCGYTVAQTDGLASGAAFPVGTTVNSFMVSGGGSSAICSFTVTVQKTADPGLVYAYTVIGLNDVFLKNNSVQSGGVGLTGAGKKARLQSGTTVTAANTFVKAPVLELTGGSQVTTSLIGQLPAVLLPAFKPNPTPTTNNVNIPNNAAPVVLTLNSYGSITVGLNNTITFTGKSSVRIKELTLKEGAKVVFDQNTELLVNGILAIGRNADFNPGGARTVQCFVGKNVTANTGAEVWANIYTLQDMRLEKANAAAPVSMTGQFIANNVYAEDFAVWNWDATRCPVSGQKSGLTDRQDELDPAQPEGLGQLHISPNPASEHAQIGFDLETASEVTVQILDATGSLVRIEQWNGKQGAQQHWLSLGDLTDGVYVVQVLAAGRQWVERLVVLRP